MTGRAASVSRASLGSAQRLIACAAVLAASALLAGCAVRSSGGSVGASDLLDFTPTEVQRIARHGPWPPPPAQDAGNAQSGRPAAEAFGGQLFFEARLSPSGRMSCATCHVPERQFADGLPRGHGLAALERNTPSLWNAVHERWQGWDGAADSLWSQAIRPLLDPREMASDAAHVQVAIARDRTLACGYERTFGRRATAMPAQAVLVDAAKAIGAFVATLVSPRTPFDEFRDALVRGDRAAAARYPAAAQRGLRLFVGRGQCALCHVGPRFSNGEFADTGLPFFTRPGVVDPGRQGGIEALRASPYNLLSRWAEPAAGTADGLADDSMKTRHLRAQHRNFGEFKVPGLRGAAHTAPYMHDGQLATLDAVVRHYSTLDIERLHADGERILKPLQLSDRESADLVAFLRTLSSPSPSPQPKPQPVCAPT